VAVARIVGTGLWGNVAMMTDPRPYEVTRRPTIQPMTGRRPMSPTLSTPSASTARRRTRLSGARQPDSRRNAMRISRRAREPRSGRRAANTSAKRHQQQTDNSDGEQRHGADGCRESRDAPAELAPGAVAGVGFEDRAELWHERSAMAPMIQRAAARAVRWPRPRVGDGGSAHGRRVARACFGREQCCADAIGRERRARG